eukprot:6287660-Amphidinium_carterae.1
MQKRFATRVPLETSSFNLITSENVARSAQNALFLDCNLLHRKWESTPQGGRGCVKCSTSLFGIPTEDIEYPMLFDKRTSHEESLCFMPGPSRVLLHTELGAGILLALDGCLHATWARSLQSGFEVIGATLIVRGCVGQRSALKMSVRACTSHVVTEAIFAQSNFIKKMSALLCQLFPLALFYIVVPIPNRD